MSSSIEWTDEVWNPTRGCSLASPGCEHCYAMRQAHRFSGPGGKYEGLTRLGTHGPVWTGGMKLVTDMLDRPLRWKRSRRIFVNSMSDLFHEALSDREIAAVFGVMAASPQHTFQILTKRAKRMREWFAWLAQESDEHMSTSCGGPPPSVICGIEAANHGTDVDYLGIRAPWPLPNVWIGVSVENQEYADRRIPELLKTAAAVRFVSAEPLIAPVDLTRIRNGGEIFAPFNALRRWTPGKTIDAKDEPPSTGLDWVIVGSESGPAARPMKDAWAREIVDACLTAGVAVFTKQIATEAGRLAGIRKGGDPKHWPPGEWPRQFPEVCR